ncbi:Fic family protein [Candidatus Shapirobacteria bacterium]|nr:Fic family protein [Candidatus Shapirobacteria bacterium]
MFNPKNPYNQLNHLPPSNIDFKNADLLDLVIEARTQLAELKGYSSSLPNPLLLLSPAIIKESLASSEIENVRTTMIEVLENQIFLEEERREPNKEVLRYRDAVMWSFEKIKKLGLSTRLITGIQGQLLPREITGYRQQQNAIQNPKTKEIIYTPPTQAKIPECMSHLEKFLNDTSQKMDPLIACILGHYQFEAIHPFRDGNGRTGRILMVLHLTKNHIISLPILYISGFINKHREEYYQRLLEVTAKGKWIEYIKFMLEGFKTQAAITKQMIFEIMKLFWELKEQIKEKNKAIYSADLVEAIFSLPVISPVKLGKILDCHYTTAARYLNTLVNMGLMIDKKIGRYHLYMNKPLTNLINRLES